MKIIHWLIVAALMQSLSACGQKGPLVLPDAEHPRKKIVLPKPPAGTPAPASSPAPATPAAPTPAPPGSPQ